MVQVFINSRTEFAVINLDKVVYLKADGNYTDFYFNDGKTKTHLSTLSSFLTDIEIAYAESNIPSPFFRMGRSYIVNTEYVASVNILNGVLTFESEIIKPIISNKSNLRSLRDFLVEKYKSHIHNLYIFRQDFAVSLFFTLDRQEEKS